MKCMQKSDSNDPLISIIIPVYNTELYLDKCIGSVLGQDYENFELLLIDDGSTDRSGEICDQWMQKDSRIRVIHQKNNGQSAARNRGLESMEGSLITFIDSDDYVTEDYLSYLLDLFLENPDCAITACNHYIVRRNKKHPNSKTMQEVTVYTQKEAMEKVLFHDSLDVSPWAKLYKKEVFCDLRYPAGRTFEDTWLFGDVLKRTQTIVYGNRCCYFYEIREQSTVNSQFTSDKLQYIDAAAKLAADAKAYGDENLEIGGVRRVNHAKLSVLRYMEHCEPEYDEIKNRLRQEILTDSEIYFDHPQTPKRDKIAVSLLRQGFTSFYKGWNLYSSIRDRY